MRYNGLSYMATMRLYLTNSIRKDA